MNTGPQQEGTKDMTGNKTRHDPLLLAAKVVLAFVMGVCAFAAFFLLIGAVAVPVMQDNIAAELLAEGKGPLPDGFFWAVSVLLLAITALLGMLIYFLQLLWRIIGSVGEGDPFVPENADRLSRMGWVAVAGNVLAFLMPLHPQVLSMPVSKSIPQTSEPRFRLRWAALALAVTVTLAGCGGDAPAPDAAPADPAQTPTVEQAAAVAVE